MPTRSSSILVIVDTSSPSPWSSYLTEILTVEGVLGWDVLDLAEAPLDEETVSNYETVALASHAISTATDEATLRHCVRAGTNLIALRPPVTMADVFGLAPVAGLNARLSDSYLVVDHNHDLGVGLPVSILQFHGQADLYEPTGANVLARFAVRAAEPTRFAAAATHRYGQGLTAAFSYDLASSTVIFHQGRAENSSTRLRSDPDEDGRWTPNDLFVGSLDPQVKFVPQADIHQDLLIRLVNWMSSRGTPAPRVWYFPDAAPCVAFINGDSDGMTRQDYDTIISTVERYDAQFTTYLLTQHHGLLDPAEASELRARGHSFGQHVALGWDSTIDEAARQVKQDMDTFEQRFGYRPATNRGHCLIWPGWTEMAEILAGEGVRMDQNFIPRRFLRHGYLNGSGLPVKFMTADGRLLDIYEQNTQLTDDGEVVPEKFLVPGHEREHVIEIALRMLDDCRRRFHGVFQAAFHPHLTVNSALWLLDAVLDYCREHGIPTVGGDDWVRFNDARRSVALHDSRYDETDGTYRAGITAHEAVAAATIMLPARHAGSSLRDVYLNQQRTTWDRRTIKDYEYGLCVLDLAPEVEVRLEARYIRSTGG